MISANGSRERNEVKRPDFCHERYKQIAPKGQHKVAGGERYSANPRSAFPLEHRPQRGRTNRNAVAPRWGAISFWVPFPGGSASTPHPRLPCASPLGTNLYCVTPGSCAALHFRLFVSVSDCHGIIRNFCD